jgi:FkbM family methyltransferase
MYYTTSMLRSLAPSHYLPSIGVELRSFGVNSADPLADLMRDRSDHIILHCIGKGRVHFHKHAWSGGASIVEGGVLTEHSLFASKADECWIDFGIEPGRPVTALIFPMSKCDPSALGEQVWLRGVEFFERQPWQGDAFPLSDFADFRFGAVGSLIVPHMDAVIGQSIKNTGSWAPKDLALFKTLVAPGDVVLDIGANIGHHTVFFSSLVGSEGKVIAFEPQLEIFRFASANLALNGCRNTTLMQGCLGNEVGEVYMAPISYEEANNFGALSVASTHQPSGGEAVPVWTLDTLVSGGKVDLNRIDFMKIDVQSFELFVLQGAESAIGRFKPKIFLEIAPHWMKLAGYSYTKIYELLKMFGYRFEHFDDGAGIVSGIRQWSGQITEEWDVLCLPPT